MSLGGGLTAVAAAVILMVLVGLVFGMMRKTFPVAEAQE
jgi:hypothetical protein